MICSIKNNGLSSIKLLIILFTVYHCSAMPVSRMKKFGISDYSKVMAFLINYGYIPKTDLRSSDLKSDDYLRIAIEKMQKYAGLNVTGNLDNETFELMQKRRCGNPDNDHIYSNEQRKKRYALNGEKWPSNQITWNIKSWPRQMQQAQVIRILQSAFAVWSDVSKLVFQQVSPNQEAEIEIQFVSGDHGDNFPFDGSGKVLAHAFYPGSGIGGDLHFDLDEVWVEEQSEEDEINGLKANQLFSVASHEIGHGLGLSHSTVFGSLMFPYYQKISSRNFRLPQDDVQAIQLLYGSNEQSRWTPVNLPTTPVPPKLPNYNPNATNKTSQNSSYPDICDTNFDAIANIRNELFFFKDKYFWRLIEEGRLERNYAVEIKQFFKFPRNIEKVDAVYERPLSKKIIFFIGNLYYEFTGNRVDSGSPKTIQSLGFPEDVKKVDAAIVWSYNGKTYFFANNKYWRFDEEEEKTEIDYPRDLSVWAGIPKDFDAAFNWQAYGLTYFTKGKEFYKFKNARMKTIEDPVLMAKHWFSQYCR